MACSRFTSPAAVTVGLLFFLTFVIPRTGGDHVVEERKAVLGSRPPGCVNKCLNCRPCRATLVVPNHPKRRFGVLSHDDNDDGGYYLLSWRCKCGNKLFRP